MFAEIDVLVFNFHIECTRVPPVNVVSLSLQMKIMEQFARTYKTIELGITYICCHDLVGVCFCLCRWLCNIHDLDGLCFC